MRRAQRAPRSASGLNAMVRADTNPTQKPTGRTIPFRDAALRGGAGLSGLNDEMFSRVTEIAISENAAADAAVLTAAEEAQQIHNAAAKYPKVRCLSFLFCSEGTNRA